MAKEKYGVEDEEILEAIRCHTTGKPGMSLLDKLLYVADYIEPERDTAPELAQFRKMAFIDLDEACLAMMKANLEYLRESGRTIDPMTEVAYEDMKREVSERNRSANETMPERDTGENQKEEQQLDQSKNMVKLAVEALEEKKGEDIKIIDIKTVSVIADYFVLASASNINQVQALVDNVEEVLYKAGYSCRQKEGNRSSTWILLDYGDMIVHVFSKEDRLFYDLERIWRDGKLLESVAELEAEE